MLGTILTQVKHVCVTQQIFVIVKNISLDTIKIVKFIHFHYLCPDDKNFEVCLFTVLNVTW